MTIERDIATTRILLRKRRRETRLLKLVALVLFIVDLALLVWMLQTEGLALW